ncbi:hypothetical protein PENFLA_c001G10188 [Penicillium flavigenum]|uniref:FHA domain-containing protein n=1 Tax=Penicillium flavigenum TaxID=254877 RepID=A0A1V6U4L4_9EURO|nr:hypothetical protein PENFLA_c001G10188 [Penicillium flavigenum]
MESLPPSPTSSGATTEPNTPKPVRPDVGRFAMLMPMDRMARSAIDAAVDSGSEHHKKFIKETVFHNRPTRCFELSLTTLPEHVDLGWRIGGGRQDLNNGGVDLLLRIEDDKEKGYRGSDEDRVAGIHARFSWLKGAGGFFLIADNKRRKKVMMNGEIFRTDQCLIQPRNTIMIGECVFFLRYETLSAGEDEQFQVELTKHFRGHYKTQSPLALPIPKENDMRFGDWIVQHPISKSAFGIVYMVINIRTGQPAAAKHISKSRRSAAAVEQELEMTRHISGLSHRRLSTTPQWYHRLGQTKAHTARIGSCFNQCLKPTLDVILHEYILISPLVNTTFRSFF